MSTYTLKITDRDFGDVVHQEQSDMKSELVVKSREVANLGDICQVFETTVDACGEMLYTLEDSWANR